MPDTTQLNIIIGGVLIVFGVLVLYGESFANHRLIVEMRRSLVWVMPRMPGPSSTVIAGVVPAGTALILGSVGGAVAGETVTLEGFPWNIGQNLMMLSIVLFVISVWFMLRPPAWALPPWYREFLARRRAGLEPDMPKPRKGSELVVTRTQFPSHDRVADPAHRGHHHIRPGAELDDHGVLGPGVPEGIHGPWVSDRGARIALACCDTSDDASAAPGRNLVRPT